MRHKDIIRDKNYTIARLQNECVEKSNFIFKLLEIINEHLKEIMVPQIEVKTSEQIMNLIGTDGETWEQFREFENCKVTMQKNSSGIWVKVFDHEDKLLLDAKCKENER